jgi:hypothetical protein
LATAPIALLLGVRENRWSDMLAFLHALDPEPLGRLICDRTGVALPAGAQLQREVSDDGDRFDILFTVGEARVAVLEVKLLAHLDLLQLHSYRAKVAADAACLSVGLSDLTRSVHLATEGHWGFLTWTDILEELRRSTHPIVSQLATMWRAHHDTLVRPPGTDIPAVRLNDHTALTMPQKVAYVAEQVAREITETEAASSVFTLIHAGVSTSGFPLLTIETRPIEQSDTSSVCVRIEFGYHRIRPVMHVMVAQHQVDTSGSFPWPLVGDLHAAAAPYAPVLHLKTNGAWNQRVEHERVPATAAGIPRAYTYGYGEKQAQRHGWCGFGCSPAVATDATVADLLDTLSASIRLAADTHQRLLAGPPRPDQNKPELK